MTPWTIKRMYPSGIYVDMLRPEAAEINITDIAWSLSMQCRFGGCCSRHYSVAEHSIFVAAVVPEGLRFEGLMHDAHEAYTQDINTGFKQALGPTFKELDERWRFAVCTRYGLPQQMSAHVHHADMVALATERRDLGLLDDKVWPTIKEVKPWAAPIGQMSQNLAFHSFLNLFFQICNLKT